MPTATEKTEAIVVAQPGIDATDRSDWEYVSVPEKDIFGKQHQGAAINRQRFERGKTYFMPPIWAGELRRILRVMEQADIRIMQSSPDLDAVRNANKSGNGVSSTFYNNN